MKIVIADPPNLKNQWLIANHPNLGALYLLSYLREKVNDVEVYYLDVHLCLEEHLRKVETISPDFYGLSFSVMREKDAFQFLLILREKFPDLFIVCGGPYPTVMPEFVLAKLPVDVCVIGEGEQTCAELVEARRWKNDFKDIPGLAFKESGKIFRTEKRKLIPDLDTVPIPAWDMIDFSKYSGSYQFRSRPNTAIITSRGCPFDCVFCANAVWKLSKPWMRLRTPQNVGKEISFLYERGIREISIRSDEFNPVLSWALDLCKEIHKLKFNDLFFQGNIRADKITDELVREMKKCNFWLVQIGIESGNQRTLDGIGKKITIEQIIQSCRLLKKYGIKVYGYIMIYHAWEENGQFCYESPEDVENTLSFVKYLKKEKLLDYMSFSTTTPIIGSRLFEIAKRHDMLRKDKDIDDLSEFSMFLPDVPKKAMKKSRRKGLLLQLALNLMSGHNNLLDWSKNWHKVKTIAKSF